MIAAVLALGLISKGTLSFSHPIDRAEVVFAALSKEIGITIRPSGALPDDRIFVRLRDTDWESAKPMLAEGLRSEWRQEGDVFYLYREPFKPATTQKERIADLFRKWQKVVEVEEDYSYSTLVERILDMQEELRLAGDEFAFESAFDSYVNFRELEDPLDDVEEVLAPAVRALFRLMPLLDADAIGELLDQPQVYASLAAKARDIPLPKSAGPIIEQFWEEREVMRRVTEVVDPTGRRYRAFGSDGERALTDDSELLVNIGIEESWLSLDLVILQGIELYRLGSLAIPLHSTAEMEDEEDRREFPLLTTHLLLTRDQDVVTKLFSQPAFWIEEDSLLDADTRAYARSILANPVENEPLRLNYQPILEQAADARNVSMVALLSDESLFYVRWAEAEPVTVGHALATIVDDFWSAESIEKDGYWLLYPRDLSIMDRSRFDRERIQEFIEESRMANALTVENLIGLFKSSGSESDYDLSLMYARFVFGEYDGFPDSKGIPLLAALSPDAIPAMRADGFTILGRDLPLAFQRLILKTVCTPYNTLTDEPFDPTKYVSYDELLETLYEPKTKRTLFELRDGIPSGVKVQLRLIIETTLAPKLVEETDFGNSRMYEFTFEEFADLLVMFRGADEAERIRLLGFFDLTKVSIGYQEWLYAIIEFPGLGFTYMGFELPVGRLTKEFIDYKDLPANIKAQVEEFIRQNDGGGQRP